MRPLIAALVVLFAGAAHAQTLALKFDRSAYPELGIEAPLPVNLDGNTATREWVQVRTTPEGAYQIRGLAARPSGLCLGQWFNPFDVAAAQALPWDVLLFGTFYRDTDGGLHRYVVFGAKGYYEITIGYGC